MGRSTFIGVVVIVMSDAVAEVVGLHTLVEGGRRIETSNLTMRGYISMFRVTVFVSPFALENVHFLLIQLRLLWSSNLLIWEMLRYDSLPDALVKICKRYTSTFIHLYEVTLRKEVTQGSVKMGGSGYRISDIALLRFLRNAIDQAMLGHVVFYGIYTAVSLRSRV